MAVKRVLTLLLLLASTLNAADFGDIPANLTLGAGQSVRRNAGDTLFEAYTPQVALTLGDLTDVGTDGITITGGTGAVVGSGTSVSQHVADGSHNGYLSSVDWTAFYGAVSGAGVSSWNTRTGAVVPLTGDYSEAQISFTDITTNNASSSAHGYHQKLPNDPTLFENGAGTYVPITVGNNQGSHLLAGGGVAYTGTGLNFTISAADYIINGVEYNSPQTDVTLAAADPSLDRIDSFYVDSSSTAGVLTGIPASNPIAPNIDPATQLYLTFAYVAAGASTPNVTTVDIYLENTEWTSSTNSAGTINLASTNNPFAGTKDIEGTSTAAGNLFTLVKPSGTLKPTDYSNLVLQLRSKATWPNPKAMSVFWMNGAVAVGTAATIKQGAFGFDSSNTSSYQQIVIPSATFNTGTSPVDRLRVQITGGGGNIGWYVDNIKLQAAGGGTTSGGDFSTNTTTSVVNELVAFADTTGKLGKRTTGTGVLSLTSGVYSVTAAGNLTDAGTDGIVVTNGTGATLVSTSLSQHVADSSHNGYLSSTDWTTFNGKQNAITPGALTKTDDTNVTLTLGGTPATALLQATSLTLGWSGTLGLSRGGLATDATNVAAHKYFGNNTGSTGSAGFNTIAASEIGSGAALTKSDDTNVTLTLGGTPTTALLAATSLTLGWSGQLALTRGGTAANLSDPGADRLWGWDDTDNAIGFWTIGTGLTYTHATHTLAATATAQTHAITFVMDGYGSVLTSRTGSYIKVPYGGTLTGWTLIGSPSGSITIDIVRAADTAGLPVTSIVGAGTKPALSSAVENKSTTFTSWTSTTLTAFDNLAIVTSGITSTTYVALTLYYQ